MVRTVESTSRGASLSSEEGIRIVVSENKAIKRGNWAIAEGVAASMHHPMPSSIHGGGGRTVHLTAELD
jgi:hypothetical protein